MVTPWVQNYSANVQRQLGAHAAVQLGYVGSLGRHLFRYRDINQLDPATGDAPLSRFRLHQPVRVHRRVPVQLPAAGAQGARTGTASTPPSTTPWASPSTPPATARTTSPTPAQPDDSTRPEREEGPSNFDQRHRFTWFFTWDLGPRKGNRIGSGWSVSGVVTLASGMPFNVNYLFEDDYNGSGEYFGRPDLVGDPFAGTSTPDKFLNLSAFQAPCTPNGEGGCAGGQHFGSLGRNAYYGPVVQEHRSHRWPRTRRSADGSTCRSGWTSSTC